jgi:hypothetical protein
MYYTIEGFSSDSFWKNQVHLFIVGIEPCSSIHGAILENIKKRETKVSVHKTGHNHNNIALENVL